jgi:hypothetical protein
LVVVIVSFDVLFQTLVIVVLVHDGVMNWLLVVVV